ncbi:hypothetical protein [Paenibacillus sacheonensis]|uniref:DUF4031 domain-containing protein n=1 Tax=Paenibacillus sacheonensis TaxID=742054 RepID=A0A7X4YTT2_9BACL|nr:hypothetical protein [Paenibacillus sacheonensis]MBM7568654.1 hypothetical protein [Paenibacillus sacheonensis]NBC72455.1 hypothetical protein [Paenibacillus sacheonensis]
MAFGVKREELERWKAKAGRGEIAFMTHYWLEPRFVGIKTVTKVGCDDLEKLAAWCRANGLDPKHIHRRQPFPHYDLIGDKQVEILRREGLREQLERFKME